MLFRKKIHPSCSYCTHGTMLADGMESIIERGMVILSYLRKTVICDSEISRRCGE